jgi:hypothetical protein
MNYKLIITALLVASTSVNAAVSTDTLATTAPRISSSYVNNEIIIKVDNINKEDVTGMLWNGKNISNDISNLVTAGKITITDDESGFVIDYKDATGLSGSGDIGFTLSNGSTVSTAVNFSNQDTASVNKKPVGKSWNAYSPRQQLLYNQIDQISWNYYQRTGQAVPMTNSMVNQMMQLIKANAAERNLVIERMQLDNNAIYQLGQADKTINSVTQFINNGFKW